MKKLIYLLVLCLCAGSVTAATLQWERPAIAEDPAASSKDEAEKPEEKKSEEKKEEEKKPEEEKSEEKKSEEPKAEEKKSEESKPEAPKAEEKKEEEKKPEEKSEAPEAGEKKPEETKAEEDVKAEDKAEEAQTPEAPKPEAPQPEATPATEKPSEPSPEQGEETSKPEAGEAGQAEQPAPEKQEGAPEDSQGDEKPQEQKPAGEGEASQPEGQSGEAPAEPQTQPEEGATKEQPATEEIPADQPGEGAPEALPEDAEAWFERDGVKLGGTLKDTVEMLEGGEKVYIRSKKAISLHDAPLKLLSDVKLLPDEDVFKGDYAVYISKDDPSDVEKPELIESGKLKELGDKADLYIWVDVVEPEKTGEETPSEPVEEEKPQLTVKAKKYVEAQWSREKPKFTLSGIPKGKNWSYTAIIYDERFVPLSDNVYVPETEGTYTVRFAMLDEIGDIVSLSDTYTLWLDWTPPEDVSIYPDDQVSFALNVSATDAISGVTSVSVDGGKNWEDMQDGETYVYYGEKAREFRPGKIRIRDAAGNVYKSEVTVTTYDLKAEEEEGGGGGGGSPEATKKPVLSHASGDGEIGVEYDTLELEVSPEPMDRLTVGGEAMDLTLKLQSAEESGAPVGKDQPFTAALRHWNGSGKPDTLLLDAELAHDLGDRFTYEWRFNGEVYRTLANSGIKYVALKVGDEVAAFPTEGFTGGTKYTELKMLGVSTRRFDYTLTMKVNLDPGHMSAMSDSDYSQACDLSIHTEVEDMDYELSSSTKSIMYFYNVYLGPEEMLNHPFGEYRG